MTRHEHRELLETLRRLPPEELTRVLMGLEPPAFRAIEEEWWWQAHAGQQAPGGDWRVWLIMAGRGFGKTRAGAEWVWARARGDRDARIALVGGSVDEVARVMVEGESGLLACARSGEEPHWVRSRGELLFPSGAAAFAYSAERPGQLRGPQHHSAWCDELAKWRQGRAAWNNLMLGLRLGEAPKAVVTTTPAPGALMTQLLEGPRTAVTRGRTADNPHLPEDFRSAMLELYGGTRLGRQELEGELLGEAEGALWTRELIERSRQSGTLPREELKRIVIGVDPPASASGDACGIVACGLGKDGLLYVLGDHSAGGLSPAGWAAKVAGAFETWNADRIVAESNNGGEMVESVLASVDAMLPVRAVHAVKAKEARAEPVASRFEAGKARFAGCFPELEDELCALTSGGGYEGPGRSPDRADAMVWAMAELMRPMPQFRISLL